MTLDTVMGAVIGAVLSFVLPLLPQWLNLRKTAGIDGIWISAWETKSTDGPPQVSEKVMITRRLGRLKIQSIENSDGYAWSGSGKLVNDRYVSGEWAETSPGAHSSGVFTFTISPRGNSMYGSWLGPNKESVVSSGRWVLGRSESDVEFGKKLLGVEDLARTKTLVAPD